ncbi:MAG: D-aminoacyl-tRNA deacylase [candidate division WOR-3 bacterium]|nr:D-aminoacyl-tRNA deacylase [candidate division WOR-3 bacterium]
MRAVIERVKEAQVTVQNQVVGKINQGLLVYLAFSEADANRPNRQNWFTKFAERLINLRIFEDSAGKMNLSVKDISGELLVISEFTLYAQLIKGHRPSFSQALAKSEAEILYNEFLSVLKTLGLKVSQGIFGAKMLVSSINDGPVTIILEG